MLEQLTKLILIIIINYVFQLAGVTVVMSVTDDTAKGGLAIFKETFYHDSFHVQTSKILISLLIEDIWL